MALSSALAESSLTIPDVLWVIDSGISRNPAEEDMMGMRILFDEWSVQTTTKQRRGRTGRCQAGKYLCMVPRELHATHMREYAPGIPTVSGVGKVLLQILSRMRNRGRPEEILAEFLEPPRPHLIKMHCSN